MRLLTLLNLLPTLLQRDTDCYLRALGYVQNAIDIFGRSDDTMREIYFAKRLDIALKSK
jgi:hypothetical protein